MGLNMARHGTQSAWRALRRLPSQQGLPLALLLLALATLFLFVIDHGYFYRAGLHGWNSAKVLAEAENLAPQWGFTRFQHLEPDQNGNPVPHTLYNRFPAGGYLLIRLVTLPFGDDLSAKIIAARVLMLACFAAAAILAYLALARTVGSRWVACTATALAFSSFYCLHYSDMISTEVPVDLLAVMLAFHGMAVFVQEDRFEQLLAKTCAALALGWHVYALLLPFIAFSLARDLISVHRAAPPHPGGKIKRASAAIFLGRPFALGVVAFVFGLLVLSTNLIGEYHTSDEPIPTTELPTWKSMTKRAGLEQPFNRQHEHILSWPSFLESQFQDLGRMFLPYALAGDPDAWRPDDQPSFSIEPLLLPFGIAALAVCLAWLCFSPQRVLLATLTLSGFAWSLPMRHNVAFHDFESVFYVGVPLTLFALTLLHVRKLSGERPMAFVAVTALLTFVVSGWKLDGARADEARSTFDAEVIMDFDAIRSQTGGGAIGIMLTGRELGTIGSETWWSSTSQVFGGAMAVEYYLSQRSIVPLRWPAPESDMEKFDFVVTDWREPTTLTPKNRRFHLYSRSSFDQSSPPDMLLGDLLARGRFDIYMNAYALIHVKSPCTEADVTAPFAVQLWPVDKADLPEHRRQYGFEDLDFSFGQRGKTLTTRGVQTCVARTKMPTYDVALIGTGQYDESGNIWWLNIPRAQ